MKEMKQALVPEVRFPEFSGEWDYLRGDNLFEAISNKNHNADLPILALTQDQGAVPRELINYNIQVSDKSIENYKVVEIDDFIISLRSFQGGIEYSRYRGLCSPTYIILRKKRAEMSSDFYRHYFKSFVYIQELNSKLEGIRDGKMISYKQFSEITIPFPSLPEQKKIAECLSSVDESIKAEDDRLQSLKDHKKGLMQKLFPKEGESIPEVRFPGFEGEWKKRKLGELGETVSGLTYNPNDVMPNGLLVLRSSNIKDGQLYFEDCVYVNPLKKHNSLKENDILICVRNGSSSLIGKCALIPKGFSSAFGAFMMVFRSNDYSFVYQLLGTDNYRKQIEQNLGARINSINSEDFKKYEFLFPPTLPEQQKIADCLSSLDDEIAAQQQKVDALKEHKKGLMQKMFPKISNN